MSQHMKKDLFVIVSFSLGLLVSGCRTVSHSVKGTPSETEKSETVETGAVLKPLVIGEPGVTGLTAGASAAISRRMDGVAARMAVLDGAQVDSFTDANGLKALRVMLPSDVLFEAGKDVLRADAGQLLAALAEVLRQYPEVNIMVFGHTDNVGTLQANQKVSGERAAAVVRTLLAQGIEEGRITASGGRNFADPVASNDTADGQAQNRRVDLYLYAGKRMIQTVQQ